MQPYLGNPTYTAAVLRSHGISARKRYGQNFLIDHEVLADTIRAAGIGQEDCVLEIGPGIGTLTQYLASAAGRVCAVEIDRSLESVLEDTLSGWNNVKIRFGDILKTDLRALMEEEGISGRLKVCANLPYYITTPILLKLLEGDAPVGSITVMVQKEVADRMQARPGTKDYGALTLAVQYRAEVETVRVVHPSSFIPQPGVDSALVHLRLYEELPVRCADEKLLFALIRGAFNQRRKKLVNAVQGFAGVPFSKEEACEAVAKCGFRPDVRGEMLTLAEFAGLADALWSARQRSTRIRR